MISDNSAFTLPHRRPTFLLNTPCLVSHYCLRPKLENDPVHLDEVELGKPNPSNMVGPKIVDPINRYLQAVAAGVGDEAPRFTVVPSQASPRRSGAKVFHHTSTLGWRLPPLDLGGIVDVDITVDIHTEYFTICIHAFPRVKASWPDSPHCPDKSSLADMLCWLTEAHGDDVRDDDAGDRVIDELYEAFWTRLFGKLHAPDDPRTGLGADCFAMFRGAVIRNTSVAAQLLLSAPQEREDEDWRPAYAPKLVKETYEEGGTPRDMTKPREVQKDLIAFANRKSRFFTRLLHFRRGDSWIDDYLGGNAILCAPLEGLALYGSTMGAERLDRNGDETNLVRYFIIYGGPSRNQLGRLVRRLHTAGECRIAALFDFDVIRAAGTRLRHLDLASSSNANPSPDILKQWRTALSGAAMAGRGGLTHRQGRANYYGGIIRQRVREMRLSRIVGWQTYDEFITRQVGPHLDTIDRIGRRFRDLDGRLRRLAGEQLAGRLETLANEISGTNTAIAEGNDRIENIQHTAEFVGGALLWCALSEGLPALVRAAGPKLHLPIPGVGDLTLYCCGVAVILVLLAIWLSKIILPHPSKQARQSPSTHAAAAGKGGKHRK